MQAPHIRPLSVKGLEALSVRETGQLLSRLGAYGVLETFQKKHVSIGKCCCVTANRLTNLASIYLQIDGAALRDLKVEDIAEIAPRATRAESKLLLRVIQDIQVATEVSLHQLSTENEGLLRQLNKWFPGKFRTAIGTPLYAHDETTVVQATHKVISVLGVLVMMSWCVITCHCMCRLQDKLLSKSSLQQIKIVSIEPSGK